MNDGVGTDRWYYSKRHQQACHVLNTMTLWDDDFCEVRLAEDNRIERLRSSDLSPLVDSPQFTSPGLAYIATAARIRDALSQNQLIAPLEASILPLPHQLHTLSKAISNPTPRYLLADEVGLGKTIEAGLILRELKLRGLVKRTVIVTPRGLLSQWKDELQTHFRETFRVIEPSEMDTYRRLTGTSNIWEEYDQIICPMDSIKPLDSRRGWSETRIAQYNRERFEDVITAGWDLVIVDEAHRLGGSNDQVARYKLGQGLGEAAPFLLLLTATPHQGKTESFHRILALLDSEAFPDATSVTKERVSDYVLRTEKRHAIDPEGKPLFKPRQTTLSAVSWKDHHSAHRALYDAVTEYVRLGYNSAVKEKRYYIGFLMILMQRLVASSTPAITASLERRLDALELPEEQLSLFPTESSEEWTELDGQEQLEMLLSAVWKAVEDERRIVQTLIDTAKRCTNAAEDPKAEALLEWIYKLQQDEGDPDLKILVFTEFVPTQRMLEKFLTDRGFSVVCLNGSMGLEERLRAQEQFAADKRVLVSTDAGGEGLNLQFCHVVVNYDIPWNPMRLEQRIGRVDRIGQQQEVRAINLVLEDTVEYRVREVLEEKLEIILREFGVDKTGDVLDSAQASSVFEKLYAKVIQDPDNLVDEVDRTIETISDSIGTTKERDAILGEQSLPNSQQIKRILSNPLPHWTEHMVVNYLEAYGGSAKKKGMKWQLTWPDGQVDNGVVFAWDHGDSAAAGHHLSLDNERAAALMNRLLMFYPGQPVPCIHYEGLSPEISGFWSLWEIRINSDIFDKSVYVPVFLHDDGRFLPPTARSVWDQLMNQRPQIVRYVPGDEVTSVHKEIAHETEKSCRAAYESLLGQLADYTTRQREKLANAIEAKRRAIGRIGLLEVKQYRMKRLQEEYDRKLQLLDETAAHIPTLSPICLWRLEVPKA